MLITSTFSDIYGLYLPQVEFWVKSRAEFGNLSKNAPKVGQNLGNCASFFSKYMSLEGYKRCKTLLWSIFQLNVYI